MLTDETRAALEQLLGDDGHVARRLTDFALHEREQGAATRREPHATVIDRFSLFLHDTLDLAEARRIAAAQQEQQQIGEWYNPLLLDFCTQFKRLRAAHNNLESGYPGIGVATLRDVAERATLYAAIVPGITSFKAVFGADAVPPNGRPIKASDWVHIRRTRKRNQNQALDLMIAADDGLAKGDVDDIEAWRATFDEEVHGSLWTWSAEGDPWRRGESPLPILPNAAPALVGVYWVRALEVGWLLLRTLPILQESVNSFGNAWADGWMVLDRAFAETLSSAARSTAVARFVGARFRFTPETTSYRE